MASVLNFVSWNVRGLSDGVKRVAMFTALKKHAAAVVCLQETHLQPDTLAALKRGSYHTQFHSTHSTFSRGVSILIANTTPFELIQSVIDDQGRYVFLLCKIMGICCIIANVYIPPPYTPECLVKLSQFIALHSNVPIWVLGDYNNVLDRCLDRFSHRSVRGASTGGMTPFAKLIEELGLRDIWRERNPGVLVYSCYSATYHCLSRIDLCLGNAGAQDRTVSISYVPRNISDHSPLILGARFAQQTQSRMWKVNPFWYELFPSPDPIFWGDL